LYRHKYSTITNNLTEYFVDVKDVARLHAIALFDPNVQSERLFGLAIPYTWKEVIDILRGLRPSCETLVKNAPPPREGFVKMVPTDRSKELLGSFFGQPDWTSLKDSLNAGITSLGL
jgi:nucleoside-diphosphate-sugar epimerase